MGKATNPAALEQSLCQTARRTGCKLAGSAPAPGQTRPCSQLGDGIGFRDARQVAFVFGIYHSLLRFAQMRQDHIAVGRIFGLEQEQVGTR